MGGKQQDISTEISTENISLATVSKQDVSERKKSKHDKFEFTDEKDELRFGKNYDR